MPMMPFIGVRNSWLMLARNTLLARLAASAASFAAASSAVRDKHQLLEVVAVQRQFLVGMPFLGDVVADAQDPRRTILRVQNNPVRPVHEHPPPVPRHVLVLVLG
jgi:hypothetical protein